MSMQNESISINDIPITDINIGCAHFKVGFIILCNNTNILQNKRIPTRTYSINNRMTLTLHELNKHT